jgi:hypothetical protein
MGSGKDGGDVDLEIRERLRRDPVAAVEALDVAVAGAGGRRNAPA